MAIDYDIVIIGGTLAGRYAASVAAQMRAKVALVEPQINYSFILQQGVAEIAQLNPKLNHWTGNIIQPQTSEISLAYSQAMLSAQNLIANLPTQISPVNLATKGVDVIVGNGEFKNSPHLGFAVKQRLLRGRTYLLASGSLPIIPQIEGLKATGYLTPANIWQTLSKHSHNSLPLPQNWVVIGGTPQSIEISQILAKLACQVTLVVKSPYLLPQIDPEIAQLLQAQLEVDGVRILSEKSVTQVMRIEDKKWIQAGDKAIEADEILVATKQQPNIEGLNLPEVGVKWHQHHLLVNQKLQTTNSRIYACGDVIGGFNLVNMAEYEAKIAVNNALFFTKKQVDYQSIPWAILSQPNLVQIGLTELQAKQKFNSAEVFVVRHYYKSLTLAQLRNEITGLCKLVVLGNGKIVGATIFGAEARELINLIALAISQNIYLPELGNLSPIFPSFSEIWSQMEQQWNQQKLNKNPGLQDWLEGWFHWRRNWNF